MRFYSFLKVCTDRVSGKVVPLLIEIFVGSLSKIQLKGHPVMLTWKKFHSSIK